MLTLGRKSGQYIVIGEQIIVQVIEVGNQMRLAIHAPHEMAIERGENYEKIHQRPACIVSQLGKKPPKAYDFSRSTVKDPAVGRKK